jgi:hypothetical protein
MLLVRTELFRSRRRNLSAHEAREVDPKCDSASRRATTSYR